MLDTMHNTATGPDGIPEWYLKLAAPHICEAQTFLPNYSVKSSTVPMQWKKATITPIRKVTNQTTPGDYRHISITSVLSRSFERLMIKKFIYPAIIDPPPGLSFSDQYAFRPTGLTTAALIATWKLVTTHLITNNYVHLIALNFSRAFDSVWDATLPNKLSQLYIPDQVYNWFVDFFSERQQDSTLSTIE